MSCCADSACAPAATPARTCRSITERIVLDGEPVADRVFADAYQEIEPYLEMVDAASDLDMSFFEAFTGLAFAIFADAPVDVAVVEVGLGGEWDATNVLDAQVAVITPIGLDHTELLGDSLAGIAIEKAGIIHSGASAILAAQPAEAAAELIRRAIEVDATVAREGLEFGVRERSLAVGGQLLTLQGLGGLYEEIFLPLHGAYQAQNAACALAAVEAFFGAGAESGPIDADIVRAAFAAVRSPGRLEAVRSAPTVLVDASHNPAGMTATVQALADSFDFRQLIGVVAMLEGKDARSALEILEPALDEVVISENGSSRAMAADELAAIAVEVFGAGPGGGRTPAGRRDRDRGAVGRRERGRRAGRRRCAGHRIGGHRWRGQAAAQPRASMTEPSPTEPHPTEPSRNGARVR